MRNYKIINGKSFTLILLINVEKVVFAPHWYKWQNFVIREYNLLNAITSKFNIYFKKRLHYLITFFCNDQSSSKWSRDYSSLITFTSRLEQASYWNCRNPRELPFTKIDKEGVRNYLLILSKWQINAVTSCSCSVIHDLQVRYGTRQVTCGAFPVVCKCIWRELPRNLRQLISEI